MRVAGLLRFWRKSVYDHGIEYLTKRRLQMRRSGTGSGGGLGMNKNVSPPVRTGTGAHNARPAGVAQLGYAVGDHATHSGKSTGYKGEALHGPASRNFQQTKFGNEVALNVGKGGPGTGRTVYHCGTQATQGPVAGNPKPGGRDILGSYGPESSRPRNPER
jgi:hypothetical protein